MPVCASLPYATLSRRLPSYLGISLLSRGLPASSRDWPKVAACILSWPGHHGVFLLSSRVLDLEASHATPGSVDGLGLFCQWSSQEPQSLFSGNINKKLRCHYITTDACSWMSAPPGSTAPGKRAQGLAHAFFVRFCLSPLALHMWCYDRSKCALVVVVERSARSAHGEPKSIYIVPTTVPCWWVALSLLIRYPMARVVRVSTGSPLKKSLSEPVLCSKLWRAKSRSRNPQARQLPGM